uniref:Bm9389 n=1 Tax=Brugia malayi TaxID=6279 RepID=A0A1I9GD31_BRUMA|nr:Bm9389 [Brugia malayi]
MSVLVGEKVDDGKNGANSNGDDEIEHELMEWHATSGLLAITTYRANVGSEINFFTHQVSKHLLSKQITCCNNLSRKCRK